MYLAKLSKVLSFAEKGRQIYNLVYFLSKPKNKEKVKKGIVQTYSNRTYLLIQLWNLLLIAESS